MINYIKEVIKPFNYFLVEARISATLAVIVTALSHFSVNYLGVSGKFSLVLLIVISADFITGLLASIYNKKRVTSRRGLRTVYKAGGYMLFMYVAYNLSQELDGKADLFEEVVKAFHIYVIVHICFWELFSIDENLKKLDIDLGVTDLLKSGYNNIKKIFNNISGDRDDYSTDYYSEYKDYLDEDKKGREDYE